MFGQVVVVGFNCLVINGQMSLQHLNPTSCKWGNRFRALGAGMPSSVAKYFFGGKLEEIITVYIRSISLPDAAILKKLNRKVVLVRQKVSLVYWLWVRVPLVTKSRKL